MDIVFQNQNNNLWTRIEQVEVCFAYGPPWIWSSTSCLVLWAHLVWPKTMLITIQNYKFFKKAEHLKLSLKFPFSGTHVLLWVHALNTQSPTPPLLQWELLCFPTFMLGCVLGLLTLEKLVFFLENISLSLSLSLSPCHCSEFLNEICFYLKKFPLCYQSVLWHQLKY